MAPLRMVYSHHADHLSVFGDGMVDVRSDLHRFPNPSHHPGMPETVRSKRSQHCAVRQHRGHSPPEAKDPGE